MWPQQSCWQCHQDLFSTANCREIDVSFRLRGMAKFIAYLDACVRCDTATVITCLSAYCDKASTFLKSGRKSSRIARPLGSWEQELGRPLKHDDGTATKTPHCLIRKAHVALISRRRSARLSPATFAHRPSRSPRSPEVLLYKMVCIRLLSPVYIKLSASI